MKCIILGNTNLNYSWFVKTFRQGLQLNGHEVFEIDYRATPLNQIYEKVKIIKPFVIFTHLTFHPINNSQNILDLYRRLRKEFGVKMVHVLADARKEPRFTGNISDYFDLALVSQTENLKKFKNYWKIPVIFCPYSSLIQEKIEDKNRRYNFHLPVFTGGWNTHEDRKLFLNMLNKKIEIKHFQTQGNSDMRHLTPVLSSSADCILGLCTGYDIEHFIDVRPFQYLGAGSAMIIRIFKGMDDIIPDNIYLKIDDYSGESVNLVFDMFNKLMKDKENKLLRKKAFSFMQRYHSSKVRMYDVIRVLEGKTDKLRAFLKDW